MSEWTGFSCRDFLSPRCPATPPPGVEPGRARDRVDKTKAIAAVRSHATMAAQGDAADKVGRTSCNDVAKILGVLVKHVVKETTLTNGMYAEEFDGPLQPEVLQQFKPLLDDVRAELHPSGSLVQSATAVAFGQLVVKQEDWLIDDPTAILPLFVGFWVSRLGFQPTWDSGDQVAVSLRIYRNRM